ncbi:MAG: chemotaxis protein CheD [Desulfobulbaceae bacterium]|nr:MAG: chemotaxis protein CheD [Desulfobulbaceae bacterium]
MAEIVLGIGGIGATNTKGSSLKTYALGSCIAVVILDPQTRTVGMVHVALPDSSIKPEKVATLPGYFVDTGIPALFEQMRRCGTKGPKGLIVKLAGGAQIMDQNNTFNIGKRNALAAKKILWGFGLAPVAEDLGDNFSRTVTLAADSGIMTLSSPGRPNWHI